jgi:anti-sigma B factor antagonist
MRKKSTPVLVRRLPPSVSGDVVRALRRELEPFVKSDGPRLVFDLSQVEEMDSAGVDMLLNCMTEATKRDGDLKLAAPSSRALVILELTQMDRLFEIFETPAEAAASFGVVLTPENVEDMLRTPAGAGSDQDVQIASQAQLGSARKLDSDVA